MATKVFLEFSPSSKREYADWIAHAKHPETKAKRVKQAVEWIADKLELQPINIYELVTFYPMFHQKPTGRHHLRVCRTLSCALGGSYKLHAHLCKKLGLDAHAHGAQTTEDGEYTVEFVECLASCGTAPVMMCNDKFYEGVSETKADEILRTCEGSTQ